MASCRTFLIWLCCALVLCTGVPLAQQTPCEATGGAPARRSCCGESCRCADLVQQGACDCGGERQPERTPQQPSPRQVQAPAPELMPRLAEAALVMLPAIVPQPDCERLAGTLPGRSRMEAFSIWRC